MSQTHKSRSIFFPVLLILVGAFLLLNTLNLLPGSTWDVLIRLWPLIFVVGGLDGLLKREGFTGAIFAIGLGTVLLLGNFGYLNSNAWHSLLRFWPLIIIAAGLDLIIGRRGKLSALVGILVGLVMVAGMFWLVLTPAAARLPRNTTPVSQALEGQTEAKLVINQAVGRLRIISGADSKNLVEGDLTLMEGEQVNWGMQDAQTFEMKSAGETTWVLASLAPQSVWDLKINPEISMDLDIETAAGEQIINLNNANIRHLDLEMAVGEASLTLPATGTFDANIEMAVGRLEILVPYGLPVRFILDTAITPVSISDDLIRDGQEILTPAATKTNQVIEIRISQPVGLLVINTIVY